MILIIRTLIFILNILENKFNLDYGEKSDLDTYRDHLYDLEKEYEDK